MRIAISTIALVACTSLASAADLGGPYQPFGGSLKDEPVATAPFSWTGLYLGAHIGYGWGDVDHAQTNGGMPYGPYGYDADGMLAGVTLGYNIQLQNIVVGFEAEGGYFDLTGESRIPSSTSPNYQKLDVDGGFYGLLAGRLGLALDRTLIYGKLGWAHLDGDAGQATTKDGYITHRSEAFEGPVYGAGIEHRLGDRISIKAEWLRFDFDTVTGDQTNIGDNSSPPGYVFTNKTDLIVDTVRVGLNYKFSH